MVKKLDMEISSALDKSILKILDITAQTPLKVSTDGKPIIITPLEVVPEKVSDSPKVQKAFEEVMHKYGPLLKKLADN